MLLLGILLVLLSILIGYLISPQIIFQPMTYSEGDVILQTIHVNEDLLVPDKVSTRLKQEKLLREQLRIYDFDNKIFEKTRDTIQKAFAESREAFSELNNQRAEATERNRTLGREYFQTVAKSQEIGQQIIYFHKYRAILEKRLDWFEQAKSLSARGFQRKAKADNDLSRVNRILAELREREAFFESERERFQERFKRLNEENRQLMRTLDEKKRTAVNTFIGQLSLELNDSEKERFDFPYYEDDIESQLLSLLSNILTRKIVVSKEILPNQQDKLEVRNLSTGETTVMERSDEIMDLSEARAQYSELLKQHLTGDESSKEEKFLELLGQKLIRPTVFENKLEYEKRKDALIANTSPVFFSLKKGEVIARAGDRATKYQVELINSYHEYVANQDNIPGMIGISLLVLLTLSLICVILYLGSLKIRIGFKQLLLMLTALLITLLLVKGGAQLVDLVETRYLNVPGQVSHYMLPVALASMLVGILIGFEAGLMVGLLSAMFCSIMMQNNLYVFIYTLMGCIVASLPMTRFDSRYSLLLHGLKISAVSLPVMLIIYLIESNQISSFNWFGIVTALSSGILTAILTSILLPFFESVFDITTNLKLLELSNMNHPALKELIRRAPGTYQHSIIVGNLAESGATKIGANPLLSRVAAYYHDIGKMNNPHCFIENQSHNIPNIHNTMDPYDSADIIIGHLTKGVEFAERYRLGKDIGHILQQHHGTNLVKYFYDKALKQIDPQNEGADTVSQQRFRYPGPKPQTLEAALVMLADVSEACCRSLDDPTPQLIRKMTRTVCWKLLEEGQLDDSGITLKTFHIVVEDYITLLTSFYHQRIKYPDSATEADKGAVTIVEN